MVAVGTASQQQIGHLHAQRPRPASLLAKVTWRAAYSARMLGQAGFQIGALCKVRRPAAFSEDGSADGAHPSH